MPSFVDMSWLKWINENQQKLSWRTNGFFYFLPKQTLPKFQSEKSHLMSRWCPPFSPEVGHPLLCRVMDVFICLPAFAYRDRWAWLWRRPRGGLPKCLNILLVVLILLQNLRLRSQNLLGHHDGTCLHTHRTPQCKVHLGDSEHEHPSASDWKHQADPDPPKGIPAYSARQTAIVRFQTWKNGDHLTRKRKSFWAFNPDSLQILFSTPAEDARCD